MAKKNIGAHPAISPIPAFMVSCAGGFGAAEDAAPTPELGLAGDADSDGTVFRLNIPQDLAFDPACICFSIIQGNGCIDIIDRTSDLKAHGINILSSAVFCIHDSGSRA